jgi:AbrB family looped-hinge helix DNA binding protein
MVINHAKITSKRQITIPIRIMRKLRLNPGDRVAFDEKKGHVEIQPAKKKMNALDLIGKYPDLSTKKITTADIHRIREQQFTKDFPKF